MSTENPISLADVVASARQLAVSQLTDIRKIMADREKSMAKAVAERAEAITQARLVMSMADIAEVFGVSVRQVQAWARTEPVKRQPKVEVVDGRTGEPVEGERAAIAEINADRDLTDEEVFALMAQAEADEEAALD